MSLGDLLGILGFVGAVLALLNEHDRRIWLAPWKRWWAWLPLLTALGFLLYLVTFAAWQGLDQKIGGFPLVSQSVQSAFKSRGWELEAKDWASLLVVALGIPASLWTWLSPLRAQETIRILEERRIASDYSYISGKVRSLLATSWRFRRALKNDLPKFFLDQGLLLHWLEYDPDLIREIVEHLQSVDLAEAVMKAQAAMRTRSIDIALRIMYVDDVLQLPQSALYRALGQCSALDLWKRLGTSFGEKTVGRGAWGSDRSIRDKTDLEILDTYAGRLCLSWIWLIRCTPLTNAFRDSSLQGCAGTAISKVLDDLDGIVAIIGLNHEETNSLLGEGTSMIDPLRKTPGAKVRVAQVVTEWFLDEWIQRIRGATLGADRQLALGSLFQFFRHIVTAQALCQMEQQALITNAIDGLCAMDSEREDDIEASEEDDATVDSLIDDIGRFNDGLTKQVREKLGFWIQSRWYWDFGRTGNARYWARLERLQQRYPISGEIDS